MKLGALTATASLPSPNSENQYNLGQKYEFIVIIYESEVCFSHPLWSKFDPQLIKPYIPFLKIDFNWAI